jgi:uncharacterized protein YndB with AHSA1/START domain
MAHDNSDLSLQASTTLPVPQDQAFAVFVRELGSWWPAEYTWSKHVLDRIVMEPKAGGACYEIGPQGFRCDWGRVTKYDEPWRVVFRWHISARREPVPDPAKASEVEVRFEKDDGKTLVVLVHRGFERHGEDGSWYRDAMASDMGWPRILDALRRHVEAA